MSLQITPQVLALLTRHEGSRAYPYTDSTGHETVGCGHNLDAHPLPDESYPLTQERISEILTADLQDVVDELAAGAPWMGELDLVRQAVCLDVAFNVGASEYLSWHHTLGYLQGADYASAARALAETQPWASQVGPRASEDALMLATGEWPAWMEESA